MDTMMCQILLSSDIHNTCVQRNTQTQPVPVISSLRLSVYVYNSVAGFLYQSLPHVLSSTIPPPFCFIHHCFWPPYFQSWSHTLSFMSTAPLDHHQRKRAWAIHKRIGGGSRMWASNTLHCGKGLIFHLEQPPHVYTSAIKCCLWALANAQRVCSPTQPLEYNHCDSGQVRLLNPAISYTHSQAS